jgi:hypothetical protein
MDIPIIQNELSNIGVTAVLIRQRIEQAQGCLGIGDVAANTEIDLAIEACKRVKSRLEAVKIGMGNG